MNITSLPLPRIDLDTLPGLPPIAEEDDHQYGWDSSSTFGARTASFISTLRWSGGVSNLEGPLPGLYDWPADTPESYTVVDIPIPAFLLHTAGRSSEWSPDSTLQQRSSIVAALSAPSVVVETGLNQRRIASVAIRTTDRDTSEKPEWVDSKAHAKNLRKTSEPIGVERLRMQRAYHTADMVAEESTEKNTEIYDFAQEPPLPQQPSKLLRSSNSRDRFLNFVFRSRSKEHRDSSESDVDPAEPAPLQAALMRQGTDDVPVRPSGIAASVDAGLYSRRPTFIQIITSPLNAAANAARKLSIYDTYERAKVRGELLQRKLWVQKLFEYTVYSILLCIIYFLFIGLPLWKGATYWLWWAIAHKFVIAGGFSITVGLAAFYAFGPLLMLFEADPPSPAELPTARPGVKAHNVALLIPCHKSARIIANTLEAALKIFPPTSIFVLANANSPVPVDNTEEVCKPYGVNHVWSPVGSKIVAQFVGCYAARSFDYVLMIDDDCTLPPNIPIVTNRMTGRIKCIGYTIKSVGANSSKGNLCQQAQDLEYKLSGLQRAFAGRLGSATFPHGAISLWDRQFLVETFHKHPGFSVSEDWFFGHAARQLGSRIGMCTSIFVETETPAAVFYSGAGGSRAGFGEMTVFKQRFMRWNFFFVNGLWYNMAYILGSWKLGFWEVGAKLFVFQEVYETLLYLLTPFVLPISFVVRPSFCGYLVLGTLGMYTATVLVFNEVHLRRKRERIGWRCLWTYYLPYKLALTFVNVASCYWSLFKYARYFAKRHPKIVEDETAVGVVLRLQEEHLKMGGASKSLSRHAVLVGNTTHRNEVAPGAETAFNTL